MIIIIIEIMFMPIISIVIRMIILITGRGLQPALAAQLLKEARSKGVRPDTTMMNSVLSVCLNQLIILFEHIIIMWCS